MTPIHFLIYLFISFDVSPYHISLHTFFLALVFFRLSSFCPIYPTETFLINLLIPLTLSPIRGHGPSPMFTRIIRVRPTAHFCFFPPDHSNPQHASLLTNTIHIFHCIRVTLWQTCSTGVDYHCLDETYALATWSSQTAP